MLLTQQHRVRFPANLFRGKNIDVAEVNEQHGLEESGLWLENIDLIYLVLASKYYESSVAPSQSL